jgi:hypothetical protein
VVATGVATADDPATVTVAVTWRVPPPGAGPDTVMRPVPGVAFVGIVTWVLKLPAESDLVVPNEVGGSEYVTWSVLSGAKPPPLTPIVCPGLAVDCETVPTDCVTPTVVVVVAPDPPPPPLPAVVVVVAPDPPPPPGVVVVVVVGGGALKLPPCKKTLES